MASSVRVPSIWVQIKGPRFWDTPIEGPQHGHFVLITCFFWAGSSASNTVVTLAIPRNKCQAFGHTFTGALSISELESTLEVSAARTDLERPQLRTLHTTRTLGPAF